MKFRTEVEIKPFAERTGYGNSLLALGSCFADNMAGILRRAKFRITANPTGVMFNPASIASAIRRFADNATISEEELSENGGVWFGYDFHGSLSRTSAAETAKTINDAVASGHEALAEADRIIITFGTAWVYELAGTGRIVANCHKRPASEFTRRKLGVNEITEIFKPLMEGVLAGKQVIFTVSPVRHMGDGADENFLSKATLKLAVAEIVASYGNACYFPAYEILNDDLRDYRFYADDLVHPSQQAIAYIREKFIAAALSDEAAELLPRIERIAAAAEHRAQNPESEAFRAFCRKNLAAIDAITSVAPRIDFTREREYFSRFA